MPDVPADAPAAGPPATGAPAVKPAGTPAVKPAGAPTAKPMRQRRAQRAAATRQRVVATATRLFTEQGYRATTVEAVAEAADVSVETIYKRFGTKRALLRAAIDLAVVEEAEPDSFVASFLELPPVRAVRAEPDQRAQLRMLAAFSRTRLEQSAPIHRMLRVAVADDSSLAEFLSADHQVRRRSQRAAIGLVAANGPLRSGMTAEEAAETYSALANPDLYLLLTGEHHWRPGRYERWLADMLIRALLPGTERAAERNGRP